MTTPGSSSHGVYTRSNLPLAVGGLTATAFDSSLMWSMEKYPVVMVVNLVKERGHVPWNANAT